MRWRIRATLPNHTGNRMVTEQAIEIRTSDGVTEGYLYTHDDGAKAGVMHLTDIGGLRQAHRDMAKRLAEQGYTVVMPNIFYRNAKPPVFNVPRDAPEDVRMKRIMELAVPLTPDAVERDANAYVDYLASQRSVSQAPMGVVGYCLSGGMAVRIAAARPERVAAAASFHGARLCTDDPNSPHLVLPRVKAQLYFGHADKDKTMPEDAIEKFNAALQQWGGSFISEVYKGAYHSWTVLDSPIYDEPEAERAFRALIQLFRERLV